MGKCVFCNQSAGIFRKKHKECEEKFESGSQSILELIKRGIKDGLSKTLLEEEIKTISLSSHLSEDHVSSLYAQGYDDVLAQFMEDNLLSLEEEELLKGFIKNHDLSNEVLDVNGGVEKTLQAVLLRNLTEGVIPEKPGQNIVGLLPFNLQKSEKLLWLFQDVDYSEVRTKTEYVGGSQGVSIRIAKGVYYRTSAFKGRPVQTENLHFIGNGTVGITTKHIYFKSTMKSFRIAYSKIVTMDPYEDGIGITKDGVRAKPQIFKGLDGWFTYNAIANLNQF